MELNRPSANRKRLRQYPCSSPQSNTATQTSIPDFGGRGREGGHKDDEAADESWMSPRLLSVYDADTLRAMRSLKPEDYTGSNIRKDETFWVDFGKRHHIINRRWQQICETWYNITHIRPCQRNQKIKDAYREEDIVRHAKKRKEINAVYAESMCTKGLVSNSPEWHKRNVESLTGPYTEFGKKLRDPDTIAHVLARKFGEQDTENFSAAKCKTSPSGFQLISGKRLTNAIWNSYRISGGVLNLGDWKGKDWQVSESAAITHLRFLDVTLINQNNGAAGRTSKFTSGASIELFDGVRFRQNFKRNGDHVPLTFNKKP